MLNCSSVWFPSFFRYENKNREFTWPNRVLIVRFSGFDAALALPFAKIDLPLQLINYIYELKTNVWEWGTLGDSGGRNLHFVSADDLLFTRVWNLRSLHNIFAYQSLFFFFSCFASSDSKMVIGLCMLPRLSWWMNIKFYW